MPGDHVQPVVAENGRFISNGYVDMGPRRELRDDRSAHRGTHRWTPEGGKDYDPTGRDTRYDRPEPNSILGRAKAEGDSDTLYRISEGRMAEEE
jgi:hypothetical protein